MDASIFSAPAASYRAHRAAIDQAVARVLTSGNYIQGVEVAAFEREWADFLGVAHAIGVASGTDALKLALRAADVQPGDAVITVSHTAVATVAAIEDIGAEPILVDVEKRTGTMSADALEQAVHRFRDVRLKAIVPVHLHGQPADLPAILDLARRYGLVVIEDCAQAHGALLHHRRVGTWGHLGAFSFYPTKNLGALGDGGAVVTNDPALAERVRLLKEYGWRERISVIPGTNSRLDELQAAILRVKLPFLEEENARRRDLARIYDRLLVDSPLDLPGVGENAVPVYHQYVVRSPERDKLRAYLADHGMPAAIHYPVPVHLQPAYRGRLRRVPPHLPATEQLAREVLSLPIHAHLSAESIVTVAGRIQQFACAPIGNS